MSRGTLQTRTLRRPAAPAESVGSTPAASTVARPSPRRGRPPVADQAPARPRGRRFAAGRRLRHVAHFSRQLQVLTANGTPLVDAVGALERQARDEAWREVLATVRGRLEEGPLPARGDVRGGAVLR